MTPNELEPAVRRASRSVASQWEAVEQDDLYQEIWVHILEAPGTQRDLLEMDVDSRYRTISKIAHRIASSARGADDRFKGRFRYSVGEVREVLKDIREFGLEADLVVGMGSSWSVGEQTSSGSSEISDPTFVEALAQMKRASLASDLREGLAELSKDNPAQYDLVIRRFVLGERGLVDAERKKSDRGLDGLTDRMNAAHKRQHNSIRGKAGSEPYNTASDGPGTRKAIRSSTAKYLSKEGYDADYAPAPKTMRDNHIEPEVWQR